VLGHFLELLFFILADVAEIALGKTVHEERLLPLPEKDDTAVAFRLACPRTGNPLLDDPAANIRINLSFFRTLDGIPKYLRRDFLLPGKTPKSCVFENLQANLSIIYAFILSHKV
jgi:hypothetical protein